MERRRRMKFIHISDLHLGAQPDAGAVRDRPGELWDALRKIVNICEKERTDLLLIAGDLFHRQPLKGELREADYIFSCLSHTRVVLMAGNHDYIRADSYYRTFRWSDNVYTLFGRDPEYVDFPDLGTAVYGCSYYSREIREPVYDGLYAGHVEPIEILLAHGGDEKHIPMDRDLLRRSGFAYIALGHIHKPQAVLKNRAVYSGALEPVDCNDTGPHGYVSGDISERHVRVMWIPSASREYIHKEVRVDESDTNGSVRKKIEKLICENGKNNIYKLVLKGYRDADISFDTEHMYELGNIVEVTDRTGPVYDFDKLAAENENGLIARYIARFRELEPDETAYQALCEGVSALIENKR